MQCLFRQRITQFNDWHVVRMLKTKGINGECFQPSCRTFVSFEEQPLIAFARTAMLAFSFRYRFLNGAIRIWSLYKESGPTCDMAFRDFHAKPARQVKGATAHALLASYLLSAPQLPVMCTVSPRQSGYWYCSSCLCPSTKAPSSTAGEKWW